MDNIIPNADSLQRTPLQDREIDEAVMEVLLHIKDNIMEAHTAGHKHVDMNIPTQFTIEGLSFAEMQRIVWCKIVRELKAKNYKVGLNPRDTECILHIEWESQMAQEEAKAQTQYLAIYTVANNSST